jgi:hypothetical protein
MACPNGSRTTGGHMFVRYSNKVKAGSFYGDCGGGGGGKLEMIYVCLVSQIFAKKLMARAELHQILNRGDFVYRKLTGTCVRIRREHRELSLSTKIKL